MRRSGGALASVCAAAVLVAGALAGCSGRSDGTASSAPAASGTRAPASAAASPSAEAQWVQAKASGLRFAVPQDWKVFDPTAVTQGKDEALVKELTAAYQVDAAQLADLFGQMDLSRAARSCSRAPTGSSPSPSRTSPTRGRMPWPPRC